MPKSSLKVVLQEQKLHATSHQPVPLRKHVNTSKLQAKRCSNLILVTQQVMSRCLNYFKWLNTDISCLFSTPLALTTVILNTDLGSTNLPHLSVLNSIKRYFICFCIRVHVSLDNGHLLAPLTLLMTWNFAQLMDW